MDTITSKEIIPDDKNILVMPIWHIAPKFETNVINWLNSHTLKVSAEHIEISIVQVYNNGNKIELDLILNCQNSKWTYNIKSNGGELNDQEVIEGTLPEWILQNYSTIMNIQTELQTKYKRRQSKKKEDVSKPSNTPFDGGNAS